MQALSEKIRRNIQSRRLFPRGAKLLVAVSGGVDSVVLLQILHQLASEFGWKIAVAHFNHQLRGRSSDADERFVAKLAARLEIPFHVARADVKAHSKAKKLSVEMAARELRHRFLAKTARRLRCDAVVLAHHADDQVELFFLRAFRGASGRGLGGMRWGSASPADSSITLARPMLNVTRAEIEKFAKAHRIAFRQDATNLLRDFLRNRIRLDLLPMLRRQYAPSLDGTVLRLMEIVGDDSEAVEVFARDWLRTRRVPFDKLPIAVQRSAIEVQLREQKCAADFDLIERLRLKSDEAVMVAPRVQAMRDAGGSVKLNTLRQWQFKTKQQTFLLKGRAGRIEFGNVCIDWKISRKSGDPLSRRCAREEFFDADRVGRRIILRHWQPGDRFQPIGLEFAVKLQDWFTNQRIPAAQRRELVIATTAAGDVFWVENQRIGEKFKLRPATRRCLRWHWNCR